MTDTMIPARTTSCRARLVVGDRNDRHEPGRATVESESGLDMEWQFGTCVYCEQPISRFRLLTGGSWYDRWGSMDESSYQIPGRTA